MTPIQASNIIKEATKKESKELANLLRDTAIRYNYSQSRLDAINALIRRILNIQTVVINNIIAQAYSQEFRKAYATAGMSPPSIPQSAVQVLAADTLRDLNFASQSSAATIESIFRLAKQDILSETQLTETVLDQLMNQGTFREASKDLSIKLLDQGSTTNTKIRSLSGKEITSRIARARRSLENGNDIPQYLKTKVFDRVEGKLREGKFITIINKNGTPMTFSLDYYSGLVARTRFADAQVQGTLDAGSRLGVQLYLVTDHNTTTEICLEFENKYLSADPKLIGKTFEGRKILKLETRSKPIYHPNCKHRLLAVPLTDEEYEAIVGGKQIAA
jgi:hypothetical protein